MIHPLHTLACWARHIASERRARRTYRALCREGRAPRVAVHIHLITDGEWPHARGTVGVRCTPPLTRKGIRLIASDARSIRRACIRQIRYDQLKEGR